MSVLSVCNVIIHCDIFISLYLNLNEQVHMSGLMIHDPSLTQNTLSSFQILICKLKMTVYYIYIDVKQYFNFNLLSFQVHVAT